MEASSKGAREAAGKRALVLRQYPEARGGLQPCLLCSLKEGPLTLRSQRQRAWTTGPPASPRSHPRFGGGPWAPLVLILGIRPESHRTGKQVILHTTLQVGLPEAAALVVSSGVRSQIQASLTLNALSGVAWPMANGGTVPICLQIHLLSSSSNSLMFPSP